MSRADGVYERGTSDQTSIVWFLSFGDLLTLLVCFFFVLTPWARFNTAHDPRKEALRGASSGINASGTQLAISSLGGTGVSRSREVVVRPSGEGVSREALERALFSAWASISEKGAGKELSLSVRLCPVKDQAEILAMILPVLEQSKKQWRSWSVEAADACTEEAAEAGREGEIVVVLEFSEA